MNIALLGPSGAGKGTHADKLVSRFDLLHVSTGDLLRHNLENHTALGILARKYMSQGDLVPDEVVDAMIEEWVTKAVPGKGILFDGFPRTVYQARFLEELLTSRRDALDALIYLQVADDEIIRRLPGRLVCHDCDRPYHRQSHPPRRRDQCNVCDGQLYHRLDDTPEMAAIRLKNFHRVTDQLVDFYQDRAKCIVVDGQGTAPDVSNRLLESLQAIARHEPVWATPDELDRIRALKTVAPILRREAAPIPSLDLVLLGGPGSGKGTQADRLCRQFNLPHIATGDLFRENLKNSTPLGLLAKSYMNRGELVPDNITESMVQERLARPDTQDGFILDGFPRTLAQAEALVDMMTGLNRALAGVIYIRVSDSEIVGRLSGRLICRNCQTPFHVLYKPPTHPGRCDACNGELFRRDDDNPATVQARLKTYHDQTAPLIEYFRGHGLLTEIEGEGNVDQITQRATDAVECLLETEAETAL